MFRIVLIVLSLSVGVVLIAQAFPLFMASMELLKVQPLKGRVIDNQKLTKAEWLALRSGYIAALKWRENSQIFLEKAKIEMSIARQFPKAVEADWQLAAEKSMEESLRRSPSNPVAWAYLAYLRSKNMVGELNGSKEALSMSLLTGPYERSVSKLRLRLSFDLWDRLSTQEQAQIHKIVMWLEKTKRYLLVEVAIQKGLYFRLIVNALKNDEEALLRFVKAANQARF